MAVPCSVVLLTGAPDAPSAVLLTLGAAAHTSTRSLSGRHRQLLAHFRSHPTALSQSVRSLLFFLSKELKALPLSPTLGQRQGRSF